MLKTEEFNRQIAGAIGCASSLEKAMNSTIQRIGAGLSALAGGVAFGKLLNLGLSFNRQIEDYKTNFTTMLQSEEKAAEMTARLKEMAAKTPFGMADLAKGAETLLSYQVAGDKVNDTLQALGDIALGDKAKLGTLTSVYGQISTAGKLLTQDLKQLRNIGFDPLTYISRRTGESLEQVTARLNKGGITVEEVTQAIKDATSQGGMFYKGMESASKTVSGQLSTLSDNAQEFLGQLSEPVHNALGEIVLPGLIGTLSDLSNALFGAEKSSEDLKRELYGVGTDGNAIDPSANTEDWLTRLMRDWTDGQAESDSLVNSYISDFNYESDRIANALRMCSSSEK